MLVVFRLSDSYRREGFLACILRLVYIYGCPKRFDFFYDKDLY